MAEASSSMASAVRRVRSRGKEQTMVFNNIIVPFDQSESAVNALHKAVEFAAADPAVHIHVINVRVIDVQTYMNYMSPFGGEAAYADPEQIKLTSEEVIRAHKAEVEEAVADIIAPVASQVTVELITGVTPADEIVSYAEEHQGDCIIMGCRGLGAVRGMLGSVSYAVIRNAEMPVLVIK
jgi:nucleotide-binding universal stress UspA family protein